MVLRQHQGCGAPGRLPSPSFPISMRRTLFHALHHINTQPTSYSKSYITFHRRNIGKTVTALSKDACGMQQPSPASRNMGSTAIVVRGFAIHALTGYRISPEAILGTWSAGFRSAGKMGKFRKKMMTTQDFYRTLSMAADHFLVLSFVPVPSGSSLPRRQRNTRKF